MSEKGDFVEERLYTIPLRRAWIAPVKRRVPRAIRIVREFLQRHMKYEDLVIGNDVNELLWRRGIEKPPRRIRVRAVKNADNIVTVHLPEGE